MAYPSLMTKFVGNRRKCITVAGGFEKAQH
jgi:hypothetical protein